MNTAFGSPLQTEEMAVFVVSILSRPFPSIEQDLMERWELESPELTH